MKKRISLILVTFILFLFGCTTIRVLNVNKEAEFSLSEYKTYNFYQSNFDSVAYPEYKQRFILLQEELEKQFDSHGLKRSATNPELLVNIGINLQNMSHTRKTDYLGDPQYMYKRDYKWESDEIVLDEFRTSNFVFDFVNAKNNKLQCMVTGDAVIVKDEKDVKNNLEVGIKKMFKKIAE
jgi:hypothetical protein